MSVTVLAFPARRGDALSMPLAPMTPLVPDDAADLRTGRSARNQNPWAATISRCFELAVSRYQCKQA